MGQAHNGTRGSGGGTIVVIILGAIFGIGVLLAIGFLVIGGLFVSRTQINRDVAVASTMAVAPPPVASIDAQYYTAPPRLDSVPVAVSTVQIVLEVEADGSIRTPNGEQDRAGLAAWLGTQASSSPLEVIVEAAPKATFENVQFVIDTCRATNRVHSVTTRLKSAD